MIAHSKAQAEGKQEGAPLLASYNDATVAGAHLLAGNISLSFILGYLSFSNAILLKLPRRELSAS